jgi:uncharacterized glyoxalase superfamily protein PhnB
MAIQGASGEVGRITPHLLVRNGLEAVEFYKRAFGAVELYRSPMPHGAGWHLHLRVGKTMVMISDETPPDEKDMGHFAVSIGSPQTLCGTTVLLELIFDDVDAAYQRAVDAGAKATLPLGEAFWGDRYGWVTDPFGHVWAMAQVIETITPEEVKRRMDDMMNQPA